MIPRIIHQTYKTKNLPPELARISHDIQTLCPTFEYRLYDDEDIIKFITENYDEETLNLYNQINPKLGMARADFFRYLVMYKVGGVYLDIKSKPLIDLDKLLSPKYTFVTSHWGAPNHADIIDHPLGEYQNWHIMCEPNHPIIGAVIESVKANIRNYKHLSIHYKTTKYAVLTLTGPICYSKEIVKLKNQYINGFLEYDSHESLGLVYSAIEKGHHSVYTGYLDNEPVVI